MAVFQETGFKVLSSKLEISFSKLGKILQNGKRDFSVVENYQKIPDEHALLAKRILRLYEFENQKLLKGKVSDFSNTHLAH